jgi:phage protein D
MVQQAPIPIYKLANGIQTFYVPAFAIKIQGRDVPPVVVRDVMQVTYRDSIDKMDSLDMTINNWDDTERRFKYVGVKEQDLKAEYKGLFDPGQKLELYMGYQQPFTDIGKQSSLKLMMVGKVKTLEQDFPNSGSPILHVSALNILDSFRKQQHTYPWENMRDSEIAHELGQRSVSRDHPGLGIEVRSNPDAAQNETPIPVVFMHNQFDILFLLERARVHGYSLSLVEEKDGKTKPHLYFGPSDRDTFITYKLEWGKSLVQFHATLTTANQVIQVTVRGWDRHTKQPIVQTATWGDPGIKINLDLKKLAMKELDGRGREVVNQPVYTIEQARTMARDLLLAHLKEMLKASGATVGLPDLRAGRTVQIEGLGQYFSGTYFITDTTHTIGNDGYRTTFNARREDESQQQE